MRFLSDNNHASSFMKWLDGHVPSCNDNDDPNHDNTVTAVAPDDDGASAGATPERPYSPWLVPGVGISI
jgi:hypothetical protein